CPGGGVSAPGGRGAGGMITDIQWLANIKPAIFRCVALNSRHHSCNGLSHSVSVTGSTGYPEAERQTVRKQPAQVKSDGKREPTMRPRRKTRTARSKLHGVRCGSSDQYLLLSRKAIG